jgi:hypothetical protein
MNALDCWKATVESGTLSAIIPDVSGEALSRRALGRLNAIGPSILPLFDRPRGLASALRAQLHRCGLHCIDHARETNSSIPRGTNPL